MSCTRNSSAFHGLNQNKSSKGECEVLTGSKLQRSSTDVKRKIHMERICLSMSMCVSLCVCECCG